MAIDHQQLRYFVEVATLRSINKAAAHLHIAQSALSRRMRQIEYDLGVDLFVRAPNGVQLTPAGRRLLGRAAALTEEFRRLREFVAETGPGPSRHLHIGMVPGPSMLLLNRLVAGFHRAAPDMVLQVVEGTTQTLMEQVVAGHLELAIVTDPPPDRRLRQRTLWAEGLLLVSPAGSGSRRRLAELPFVVPSQSPIIRSMIDKAMKNLGLPYRIDLEMASSVSVKRLISSGGAYSILPYSAVSEDIGGTTYHIERVPGVSVLRHLVWPAGRILQGELRELSELIDVLVADIVALDPTKGLLPAAGGPFHDRARKRRG